MNKKVFVLAFSLLLSACSNSGKPTVKIKVENILYEGTILTFDSVANASGYSIKMIKKDNIIFQDVIRQTRLDTAMIGAYGSVKAEITPLFKDKICTPTEFTFVSMSRYYKITFEAESGSYNIGTGKDVGNYRWNECASDTYYIGGIDDAGQGVYYNLLVPEDGVYELICHYASLSTYKNCHDDVWVNNHYVGRLNFNEGKGWFGSSEVGYLLNLPTTSLNIPLVRGWNTISVFKNGDASDNWGSFAELDYFDLIGKGTIYNPDELEDEFGEEPSFYRLEGEMGSPRKLNPESLKRECKNPPIVQKTGESFSNGFVLGNIENNFDGVEWRFKAKRAGLYNIKLCYSSAEFEDSKLPNPVFIVTQEPIDLDDYYEFSNYDWVTYTSLSYTNDWSTFTTPDENLYIYLKKGVNYIYCLLTDEMDSGFFEIDYADLSYAEE